MGSENMVQNINRLLERIGSKFSTSDGKALVMPVGSDAAEAVFLRKTFDSPEECYHFVADVAVRNGRCV